MGVNRHILNSCTHSAPCAAAVGAAGVGACTDVKVWAWRVHGVIQPHILHPAPAGVEPVGDPQWGCRSQHPGRQRQETHWYPAAPCLHRHHAPPPPWQQRPRRQACAAVRAMRPSHVASPRPRWPAPPAGTSARAAPGIRQRGVWFHLCCMLMNLLCCFSSM